MLKKLMEMRMSKGTRRRKAKMAVETIVTETMKKGKGPFVTTERDGTSLALEAWRNHHRGDDGDYCVNGQDHHPDCHFFCRRMMLRKKGIYKKRKSCRFLVFSSAFLFFELFSFLLSPSNLSGAINIGELSPEASTHPSIIGLMPQDPASSRDGDRRKSSGDVKVQSTVPDSDKSKVASLLLISQSNELAQGADPEVEKEQSGMAPEHSQDQMDGSKDGADNVKEMTMSEEIARQEGSQGNGLMDISKMYPEAHTKMEKKGTAIDEGFLRDHGFVPSGEKREAPDHENEERAKGGSVDASKLHSLKDIVALKRALDLKEGSVSAGQPRKIGFVPSGVDQEGSVESLIKGLRGEFANFTTPIKRLTSGRNPFFYKLLNRRKGDLKLLGNSPEDMERKQLIIEYRKMRSKRNSRRYRTERALLKASAGPLQISLTNKIRVGAIAVLDTTPSLDVTSIIFASSCIPIRYATLPSYHRRYDAAAKGCACPEGLTLCNVEEAAKTTTGWWNETSRQIPTKRQREEVEELQKALIDPSRKDLPETLELKNYLEGAKLKRQRASRTGRRTDMDVNDEEDLILPPIISIAGPLFLRVKHEGFRGVTPGKEDEFCTQIDYLLCRAAFSTCKVTNWSEWSTCSAPCGKGTRYRWREVVKGECKMLPLEERQPCTLGTCPKSKREVECVWAEAVKDSHGSSFDKSTGSCVCGAPLENEIHSLSSTTEASADKPAQLFANAVNKVRNSTHPKANPDMVACTAIEAASNVRRWQERLIEFCRRQIHLKPSETLRRNVFALRPKVALADYTFVDCTGGYGKSSSNSGISERLCSSGFYTLCRRKNPQASGDADHSTVAKRTPAASPGSSKSSMLSFFSFFSRGEEGDTIVHGGNDGDGNAGTGGVSEWDMERSERGGGRRELPGLRITSHTMGSVLYGLFLILQCLAMMLAFACMVFVLILFVCLVIARGWNLFSSRTSTSVSKVSSSSGQKEVPFVKKNLKPMQLLSLALSPFGPQLSIHHRLRLIQRVSILVAVALLKKGDGWERWVRSKLHSVFDGRLAFLERIRAQKTHQIKMKVQTKSQSSGMHVTSDAKDGTLVRSRSEILEGSAKFTEFQRTQSGSILKDKFTASSYVESPSAFAPLAPSAATRHRGGRRVTFADTDSPCSDTTCTPPLPLKSSISSFFASRMLYFTPSSVSTAYLFWSRKVLSLRKIFDI